MREIEIMDLATGLTSVCPEKKKFAAVYLEIPFYMGHKEFFKDHFRSCLEIEALDRRTVVTLNPGLTLRITSCSLQPPGLNGEHLQIRACLHSSLNPSSLTRPAL